MLNAFLLVEALFVSCLPIPSPIVWCALTGYLALTMLNPISLAAHATFWLLLGLLVGAAEPARLQARNRSPRARATALVLTAPVALAALSLAVLLPLADLAANRGWEAYAAQDFHTAAEEYRLAGRLLPLERRSYRHRRRYGAHLTSFSGKSQCRYVEFFRTALGGRRSSRCHETAMKQGV